MGKMIGHKSAFSQCDERIDPDLNGSHLLGLAQHAHALMKTVSAGMNRIAASYGLSPSECALIRTLPVGLELTATELAPMLSMNTSSVSRTVKGLVERGLLNRRRPRDDRRMVFLRLTEEGAALRLELCQRVREFEQRLTEDIGSEDLENCLATIRDIVKRQSRAI